MKNSLEEVRKIFQEDKELIIKKYAGTGAGIGMDKEYYIIVVYTDKRAQAKSAKRSWKDIPVKIRYTGEVKLQ